MTPSVLHSATAQLAHSSDSPRLDAELLLAHVLKVSRTSLIGLDRLSLSEDQQAVFNHLLTRRAQGEPVAYLLGTQEFYLDTFIVSPKVLIPRPETELLIDWVVSQAKPTESLRLLDLGTGSGAIGLTLARLFPKAQVDCSDASSDALEIARANAAALGRTQVQFFKGSWFDPLPERAVYDFILSNPPYLLDNDPKAQASVLKYEPLQALTSGPTGLESIEEIIHNAPGYLKPNGQLALEHGLDQGRAVRALLGQRGFSHVRTIKDLAGLERVTGGRYIG